MTDARLHPDWIVPDWPAPAHVHAFVTTRAGGASAAPFDTFNLGLSTGDDRDAVEENRRRLRAVLPSDALWLHQVHGARVVDADEAQQRPKADACVTADANRVCTIQIADCLPILLADRAGKVVGAAHAGWRGLAAGVIDNTVAAMSAAGASELLAFIGPGIGPAAFEVGDDVREAYVSGNADAAAAFKPYRENKWLADLPQLARRALTRCGVTAIYGGNLCTWSEPARFYSYRRDKTTGRMAALIWRDG